MSKPIVNVEISTLPFSDRVQLVQETVEARIRQTTTTNPAHMRARSVGVMAQAQRPGRASRPRGGVMNSNVESILKQIKGSASSLEIMAGLAISGYTDEAGKAKMLECTLSTLEHLQWLHDNLKQAVEGAK